MLLPLASLISLYFWQLEGGYPDAFFATAVTLTIAAATVLVCRRIMIAAALVAGLVATIRVVSAAKQQASEVLLHAHDAVTLLAAWQTWPALWTDHRRVVLGAIAVLLATAAATLIAARFDLTRVARPHAAAALAMLAAVTWIADATRGERRHTEFYFESNYVTFFYASWSEMARALWQGQFIDALPARLVAPARARSTRLAIALRPRSRPTSSSSTRNPWSHRPFSQS